MPDGIPPTPQHDDFDMESALHRAAHAVLALHHPDIPADLIDDQIEHDDALRTEYYDILKVLHPPTNQPRRTIVPWAVSFGQPRSDT